MSNLRGVRVLVVEDEPLLSLNLQELLADLGCEISGAAARLEQALEMARDLAFDVAVLDINLAGERVDPVADVIVARGLPVVFVTGYSGEGAPGSLASAAPVLHKPYQAEGLEHALTQALASRQA